MSVPAFSCQVIAIPFFSHYNELSSSGVQQKHKGDISMSVDAKRVGEQILSLRKSKGLTQQELGERLNISFQAISKWERGVSRS